jgi:hypothetical protein
MGRTERQMTQTPTTSTARLQTRLVRALDLAYLRWALRSIHPLHPDVAYIRRQIEERSGL